MDLIGTYKTIQVNYQLPVNMGWILCDTICIGNAYD